ncbi:hypothetical protein HJC23_000861 [Cyclotella cryptica]|uniref:Uncharacterized protein n=1 Tax=Cyclotella cryptica TaxID=29204 RepID=A0ABD3PT37_9STRA|eukprot:CCRYP_011565-RA/>CCRYP_011565-RA protein AED:0.44 eAED:0.44 QI:0/-1/0/1/-1/1/1/0/227
MRFFRAKRSPKQEEHNKIGEQDVADDIANASWTRRKCVDDMLKKLVGSELDSTFIDSIAQPNFSVTSGDSGKAMEPLRLKILMSLSLAEERAQSEEGLMKVKRLKSKILSNFVRLDESPDTSFVSWNSHHSFDSSDEDMGYEVINHSTQDYHISAVRINELPEENLKYYHTPMGEAFEVNIISDRLLKDNYMDVPESGYEVSIDDAFSIKKWRSEMLHSFCRGNCAC